MSAMFRVVKRKKALECREKIADSQEDFCRIGYFQAVADGPEICRPGPQLTNDVSWTGVLGGPE